MATALSQKLSCLIPGVQSSTVTVIGNGQLVQSRQSLDGAVLRTTSASYTLTGKTATATSGRGDDDLELVADLGPDRTVNRRVLPFRLAVDHRIARIGGGADRHVQGDFAEERHAEFFGLVPCAAMAEDVGPGAAMRALEIAHVLDNAEHGHVDLPEHRQSAPCIDQ